VCRRCRRAISITGGEHHGDEVVVDNVRFFFVSVEFLGTQGAAELNDGRANSDSGTDPTAKSKSDCESEPNTKSESKSKRQSDANSKSR